MAYASENTIDAPVGDSAEDVKAATEPLNSKQRSPRRFLPSEVWARVFEYAGIQAKKDSRAVSGVKVNSRNPFLLLSFLTTCQSSIGSKERTPWIVLPRPAQAESQLLGCLNNERKMREMKKGKQK
jgi:hypothetical protein